MSEGVRSIKGTITLTDGTTSEFQIVSVSGDPAWFQWGDASTERMSRTVDVLDAMQEAVSGYLVDDRDDEDDDEQDKED